MKILFLDDDQIRHDAFKKANIGCVITHVYTAKECIGALESNPAFDLVSLDHDLGGEVFTTKEEGSGYEVAKFIRDEMEVEDLPAKIIVHSFNSVGAMRMVNTIWDRMRNVSWRRFGT